MKNLHALYVEQFKDLYSAETQLIQALPKMAQAAPDPQFQAAGYGTVARYAQVLGKAQHIETLHVTESEEKKTDQQHFTTLSETIDAWAAQV